MTRRIVRSSLQLAAVVLAVLSLILFIDNRFRVLPQSIHSHLPLHHDGLIITDVTIRTCSTLNPLSQCTLNGDEWHRIEKDLYLNSGWFSRAYLHVQRKREEELLVGDTVILNIKVGRIDPALGEKNKGNEKWEARPGGIWLHRSAKRQDSDSQEAITAVDVLFGPDAVEPRLGWSIRHNRLLLDDGGDALSAHISIRHGRLKKIEKPVLRIRKDGKFKIMQLADLHLSTGLGLCRDAEPPGHNGGVCEADTRTLQFVHRLLDAEEPDLIVLSGDQVNGDTAPDVQSAIFKFADLFVNRPVPIPYAAIFGNHDDEGPLSRQGMMTLMESLPYSLSEAGPATVDGVGNYVLEIASAKGDHSALTLFLLDTHGYSPDERQFKGYDWLKESQLSWFRDAATRSKHAHKSYTKIHMDMAFIHIPLPEYRDERNLHVGAWREPPTAPAFNSHFRDALVEQGVLAVSAGHDHVNDYCALSTGRAADAAADAFATPQLWMCYGGATGFGGYAGYGGYHRRVRMFEVDTNAARIRTWKRLEWGETEKRIDEQTIVEGGRIVAGQE